VASKHPPLLAAGKPRAPAHPSTTSLASFGAYLKTGTSAALEVVFNKGSDGRGRPSYANGSGLNGQESPFWGAVFVA